MLDSSFDSIFLEPKSHQKDIQYWRNKIRSNIISNSRDKYRNSSCEIVQDLTQLSNFCKFLRSEESSTRKRVKKHGKKVQSVDKTIEDDSKLNISTDVSTPLSNKSYKDNSEMHLITFRPGVVWSENTKPRRHFPREVFTNRKLF